MKAVAWFAILSCLAIAIGFELNDAAHYRASRENHTQPTKKPEYVAPPQSADDRIARYTLWLAILTGGLVAVAVFQGYFLIRADKTARISADAAQEAADAAKLNAQAVVDAERAHLYVIIKSETIENTFAPARMYDNSPSMHQSKMNAPAIQYVLRNYGKTPAILHQVMHGISIQATVGQTRTLTAGEGALEVVGVNQDAPVETVIYTEEPFTFGDARALVLNDRVLYFFGEAYYSDAFGGSIKLEWEFIADNGKLRQIQHRETRQT